MCQEPRADNYTYNDLDLCVCVGFLGPATRCLGFPFCLTEIRGDWAWHLRFLKLQASWNRADHVCHACNATKVGPNSWQPLLTANHALRSNANFLTRVLGRWVNPLLATDTFDSSAIKFCSMHIVNLGVLQQLSGGCMDLLLCWNFFGEGTLQTQLTEATHRFKKWASSCGVPHSQGFILPGHLYHGKQGRDYPLLTLKAFNSRVFLPFLCLCLSILYSSCKDLEVGLAYVACQRLSAWFDLLERCDRYLEQWQAAELHEHARVFVTFYLRLAKMCVGAKVLRYQVTPKLHVYLRHLAQDPTSNLYNVRFHHCYVDEDLMGTMKSLAKRAHRSLLEYRVLTRWQLRLKVWEPRT